MPPHPGSWPCYRGPRLDGISPESVRYLRTWGSGGPSRLWSVTLGEGHAGAAVHNSRVYVLDYDMSARADKLRCFALATGAELWSYSYPVEIKRNHGISRTVPAVWGKYVVALGPKCHVTCCDAETGKLRWSMDLVRQYGATVPAWYTGQCPIIDNGRAILAPGGRALMIAVECATGKVLWETPNPRGWKMTHSSIVPMTVGGQRMYVYCASGGVVGVSPSDGSVLWETTSWTVSTANIPVPVPVGDDRVFLCGGYNSGAMMIRLRPSGGKFSVEQVFRLKPQVFGSDQQSPILYQGHLYGVIPGGQLACLDLNGTQRWISGSTATFGLGPYSMTRDGLLYLLSDKGDLHLIQADPAAYRPLARARILNGPDAWAPMAIAGGLLIARDITTMVCLRIAG